MFRGKGTKSLLSNLVLLRLLLKLGDDSVDRAVEPGLVVVPGASVVVLELFLHHDDDVPLRVVGVGLLAATGNFPNP